MTHPTCQSILESFEKKFEDDLLASIDTIDGDMKKEWRAFIEQSLREAVDAMIPEPTEDDLNVPKYFTDGLDAARQAMLTKRAAFFGEVDK